MMKNILKKLSNPFPSYTIYNVTMLLFRIALALEMMIIHGFKKLGIGVSEAEIIPNPFNLPQTFNDAFIISANFFFPFLVLIGFYTRLSALPVLVVTVTGYLIVHRNEALIARDIPFMYSISFLSILLLGPGKYSIDHFIYKKNKL
jgi:putative oxidoreductase